MTKKDKLRKWLKRDKRAAEAKPEAEAEPADEIETVDRKPETLENGQKLVTLARDPRHCPRCGSWNTVAVSTQGRIQYRKCRNAICRFGFKAIRGEDQDEISTE